MKSRSQVESEMCQRRQKSDGDVARYGWLKFIIKSIPSSRAVPRAMSV